MAITRIDVHTNVLADILKSAAVRADLVRRARQIAAVAGDGYVVDSQVGAHRARASVRTDTFDARYQEATHRELTRALDAGRH